MERIIEISMILTVGIVLVLGALMLRDVNDGRVKRVVSSIVISNAKTNF